MADYTADFCDTHPDKTAVLGPGYSNFGGACHCGAAACEREFLNHVSQFPSTIAIRRNRTELRMVWLHLSDQYI